MRIFIAGYRGNADWTRQPRFHIQSRQNDNRQALLRMQGPLPGPKATGLGHVLARMEISGKQKTAEWI